MKQEIIQRLRGLSDSTDVRPAWAILKDCIAEIDVAIASGVKIETIEKTLADLGLDLAPTSLRSALYRFRKKRKNKGTSAHIERPIPGPSLIHEQKEGPREPHSTNEPAPPTDAKEKTPVPSNPWAYRSELSPEEKEYLSTLSPTEKIEYFRQQAQRKKFIHNPTPERFRKEGE
jgi:hypothetical protein